MCCLQIRTMCCLQIRTRYSTGNASSCKKSLNTYYRSDNMSRIVSPVVLQLNTDPRNKNLLPVELIFISFTLATPCSSSLTRVRICSILSMLSGEILWKLLLCKTWSIFLSPKRLNSKSLPGKKKFVHEKFPSQPQPASASASATWASAICFFSQYFL